MGEEPAWAEGHNPVSRWIQCQEMQNAEKTDRFYFVRVHLGDDVDELVALDEAIDANLWELSAEFV